MDSNLESYYLNLKRLQDARKLYAWQYSEDDRLQTVVETTQITDVIILMED